MSFFGFGKSKTPESAAPTNNYAYEEESSYDYATDASTSASSYSSLSSHSPSSSVASHGPSAAAEIQQFLEQEQSRVLVQQAIQKIANIAWDKCISSKPGSELSSSEKTCITNITLSYMQTSIFLQQRLNKAPGGGM
jgi:hypothetical protein